MPELVDVAPGSPEWLAARRTGVTATDIPAICGLVSWESPWSLFQRKLGLIPDVPDSDLFRIGRELEPYARERWAQEQAGPWHFHGGALWQSSERPWQMATVDYQVGPGLDYREPLDAVLELKTTATWDGWDDHPPVRVRAQVLWQMDVMGVATGHVGALNRCTGEFRSYVIEHDESPVVQYPHDVPGELWPDGCQACADIAALRLAGSEFYARLTKREPPDVDGSAATLAALRARYQPRPGKTAVIHPDLWWEYDNANIAMGQYKEMRDLYQAKIRALAEDCGDIEVDGEIVARFDRRGALRRVKAKEENGDD